MTELETLVNQIGECDELTVMEPTCNAWVPVAAHFMTVVLTSPNHPSQTLMGGMNFVRPCRGTGGVSCFDPWEVV